MILFFLASMQAVLADDFFSPPQLDPQPPPWIQEAEQGQPNVAPQGQEQDGQNEAPSSEGPPPGFWGDEEAEESDFSFSPRSAPTENAKPKDSFKLVEPWKDVLGEERDEQSCLGWGHPFLGITMFQNHSSCDFMLSQKVEESKNNVRSLEDHTRNLVLKEVIQGKVARDHSKKFVLNYDLLMEVLQEAKVDGCRCLQ